MPDVRAEPQIRGQNADQRDSHLVQAPAVSLPKGGGAIRGIGEKFAANPVTGTGSMTVPIATSPGRSGFGPQLSLSYDSGAGNGPFGLGWNLSLPSITRKTDKGLPQYRDAEESDVFILSGAEDLVPVLAENNGEWKREKLPSRTIHGQVYRIQRYRPRIEGLFARIERWTNQADPKDTFWRSISKDNITTWYGKTEESRIAEPADPSDAARIFSWLICESYDDKGNVIVYQYAAENDDNVDRAQANERNRVRTANRYLKHIKYGNRTPNRDATTWQATDPAQLPNDTWMFEVVFDYGEGHYAEDTPDAQGRVFARAQIESPAGSRWPVRQDPFSTYRAGFEVRTYRLCRRVLMFHHFPQELGINDCLVRSTEFSYAESPIASFITGVTQSGYVRQPAQNQPNRYLKKSLPPLEFEYSQVPSPEQLARQAIREIDAESLENLPVGLDGVNYQWMDLDGEGTSGILTEQADGWYYKRNLSSNNLVREDGHEHTVVRFGATEVVARKPVAGLAAGGQFLDLAGDGQVDLVQMEGPLRGFYERTEDASWAPFQPFTSWPDLNTRDPDLKFVDLTGDGHADILITEGEALTWYPSLAETGFGPAVRVSLPLDEEKGPRLVFADGEQSIYLADLSGDGLSDLVRIRNGEVCYWPNLGYGHFGGKVTMDDAPWFDSLDQFDQRRIRLADTDGSGTTDILYLRRDGVQIYFNQSGNGWSDAVALPQFPPSDNISSVQALDLLGNGTACLVWSSPLLGAARRPMRYLALMDEKPHLLVGVKNNLGAETRVHYAPSTKFYLDDKRDGKPWITHLPFPVHVVERVETYDRVSHNRFVTRYAYHHGYFDGEEREFRGFGMVEQWDTEEIGSVPAGEESSTAKNLDAASFVPPVHTKTWFHTGVYLGRDHVSNFFAGLLNGTDRGEYFREPGLTDDEAGALLLPDTVLPPGLTLEEEREACRALKGAMLRQEVYSDDAPADAPDEVVQRSKTPYTVTEQNFTIERLQPRGDNRHAVFFTHAREATTYHYERNPIDPRIQHALTLEVDAYGNVLRSMAVGYPRRSVADRQAEQNETHLTLTLNRVINRDDGTDEYRVGLPAETRNYELVKPPATIKRFTWDELRGLVTALVPLDQQEPSITSTIPYDQWDWRKRWDPEIEPGGLIDGAPKHTRLRLIEHARTLYRPDDLGISENDPLALLPLGTVQSLALPGESYKLAFTPGLLAQIFERRRTGLPPEALLPDPADVLAGQGGDRGGYLQSQSLKADGRFPDSDADDHWWIPSGRVFYSLETADAPAQERAYARDHFFLSHRYRDPFGQTTFVSYDSDGANPQKNHNLLAVRTEDAVGNTVTAGNDYRVLQPIRMTDPNGNRSEVRFDALGMVVGTAVMGKAAGPIEGDSFETFSADLTPDDIKAYFDADDPCPLALAHLGTATTRILYDLDRVPACGATIARETHVSGLAAGAQTKLQLSFSYSDGFGREIQKKIQAEPGPVPLRGPDGNILVADGQPEMTDHDVSPRWVGSGWTIFNNKGKPVRQFEPFFSDTHKLDSDVRIGVSPWLFYDPVERVVATLHPNHSWEKVVFDPWRQTSYDVNDTLLNPDGSTDPKNDPDVAGFFRRLPDADYLPTWYELRTVPAYAAAFAARYPDAEDRANETKAASKAAAHADTPTTAHFDTLGRPFLTLTDNGPDPAQPGQHLLFATRVELDIEGNQRAVRDAIEQAGDPQGRIVMRYGYDMLGSRIHQLSMEAGARWMLNDVTGKPIRAWDSRGHNFVTAYDALRRPVAQYVRGTTADSDPRTLNRDIQVDKIEYGEGQANAETLNLRTRIYRHSDSAGVATNAQLDATGKPTAAYDFKGNLLRSTRRLVSDYQAIPDWLLNPKLDDETFTGSTRYDALNRPVQSIAPHSSFARAKRNIIQPVFNEANLLERVDVWLDRAAEPAGPLNPALDAPSPVGISNIDYDAKGQRKRIDYKNGASTFYDYDPLTFRLVHLLTRRAAAAFPGDCPQPPPAGWPGCQAQNLSYSYDPAGNITHIQDDAQQTIYFKNQRVEPSNDYTYDALYRLIDATGREHLGQGGAPIPHSHNDAGRVGVPSGDAAGRFSPNDGQAMGTYIERYVYDAVGNFAEMQHRGGNPVQGWSRSYAYAETSLIEDGSGGALLKASNRLSRTTLNANGNNPLVEPYQHDAHGNMVRMPHLGSALPGPNMHWDYKDQLRQTDLGGGGTAYYVYDASGQRMRKVWQKAPELTEERIYLGGFEIFRRHGGAIGADTATLERETLHIMDDKQRIALVETRTLDTAGNDPAPAQLIHYQFGNHLGSASLELDDQAQIISYEEYTPYGSTSYQAVRSQTETPKRYRFTGKERDEETGFSYHGARYYAGWLGRWVSCDPAGLVDGVNLFCYGRNNSVRLVDPNGRAADDVNRLKGDVQRYTTEAAENESLKARVTDELPKAQAKLKQASKGAAQAYNKSAAVSEAAMQDLNRAEGEVKHLEELKSIADETT